MDQHIISACTDAIVPIIEMSIVLAGDYVKACGRSCITSKDQEYALKYCAIHKVGEHMGSMFPEIYEDSSDSDEEDIELVDETQEENKFVRYSGTDDVFLSIIEDDPYSSSDEPGANLESYTDIYSCPVSGELTIYPLVEKVKKGVVKELIFALSSTMEGDTTNFYIFKQLEGADVITTTIARGISVGDELEYADEVTLGRSIVNRIPFENSLKNAGS